MALLRLSDNLQLLDMDPASVDQPTALPNPPTSTRAVSSALLLRAHTVALVPHLPHLAVATEVLHHSVAMAAHHLEALFQEALLALAGVVLQVLLTVDIPATVALSAPASDTDFPTVIEVPLAATESPDRPDMALKLTLARRTSNLALLLVLWIALVTVPLILTRTESMTRITRLISQIRDKKITTSAASTRTELMIKTTQRIKAPLLASIRTRFTTRI